MPRIRRAQRNRTSMRPSPPPPGTFPPYHPPPPAPGGWGGNGWHTQQSWGATTPPAQTYPPFFDSDSEAGGPPSEVDIESPENDDEMGTLLDVKRLDLVWDQILGRWNTQDTPVVSEEEKAFVLDDPYKQYAFVYTTRYGGGNGSVAIGSGSYPHLGPIPEIEIKSRWLRQACKEVVGKMPGVSWTAEPLVLDPLLLLSYLPEFEGYLSDLKDGGNPFTDADMEAKKEGFEPVKRPENVARIISHLDFLLDFLRLEFKLTLESLKSLLKHGEITHELLWALLRPQTILYAVDPSTSEPRVVRLINVDYQCSSWTLNTEYVELDATQPGKGKLCYSPLPLNIGWFKGTTKINTLDVFPISWHHDLNSLKKRILDRGGKWLKLLDVHHVHYSGPTYDGMSGQIYHVKSRIMVDRSIFAKHCTGYPLPMKSRPLRKPKRIRDQSGNVTVEQSEERDTDNLDEDELLLTPPLVYGFSLEKKLFLEFRVERISDIVWNDEAFQNLVLPDNHKELIQSLVECHSSGINEDDATEFDDFVQGKGRGLVINLYGNPGVGKSMTAEATSEHLRKPLYLVGAGDLSTSAMGLDAALTQVMDLSAEWGAVILIDEADVFLEQRSMTDVHRNSMVAVFLRKLEYFRGILFLTTNMVETFDRAFHSRIHLALRYPDLSPESMRKIWSAFIKKAIQGQRLKKQRAEVKLRESQAQLESNSEASQSEHEVENQAQAVELYRPIILSEEDLHKLSLVKVNGRQIKNIVMTATVLANSRGEELGYSHLNRMLGIVQEFQRGMQ